jgi:hypothetical protein
MPVWQFLKDHRQKQQKRPDNYSRKSYLRQAVVPGKAGVSILKFPVYIVEVGIVLWTEFKFYVQMRNDRND